MAKYSAYGTQLQRVSTPVAQVRSITGPGLSLDTLDVTSHDSTGAWREFVAGLLDAGEATLDLIYDPDAATQTSLRTDMVSRAAVSYKIQFPDTTPATFTCNAFVTQFEPDAPVDGDLTATATLKFTGQPTWA